MNALYFSKTAEENIQVFPQSFTPLILVLHQCSPLRTGLVGRVQVRVSHVKTSQVRTCQVGTDQVDLGQVNLGQYWSSLVKKGQVNLDQVKFFWTQNALENEV